jgi:hypothetical protein
MAEDIHAQVEDLMSKIGDALEALLTLRVETVITPLKVKAVGNGDWAAQPEPGEKAEGAVTIIRLDQGDLKNAISEAAIANEKLMAMHSQQVAMSRQIVADNMKAVVELARSLAA